MAVQGKSGKDKRIEAGVPWFLQGIPDQEEGKCGKNRSWN
jgi:hypothetical protein